MAKCLAGFNVFIIGMFEFIYLSAFCLFNIHFLLQYVTSRHSHFINYILCSVKNYEKRVCVCTFKRTNQNECKTMPRQNGT